jgi:hypothetical protein
MNTNHLTFPDVLPVFLRALDYPEYARPEYFIKEQMQSGWSKGVYLNALGRLMVLTRLNGSCPPLSLMESRRGKPRIRQWRFLPVAGAGNRWLPKGIVDQRNTQRLTRGGRICLQSWNTGKDFHPFEILSFFERMLLFIKKGFDEQVSKNGQPALSRSAKEKKEPKLKAIRNTCSTSTTLSRMPHPGF